MVNIPLFDIDDTLLRGGNTVHEDAFDYAIKKVFDIDVKTADYDWTGMVDDQIFVELLFKNGIENNIARNRIGDLNKLMGEYFLENHSKFVPTLMPGVLDLLKLLTEKRMRLGLLTGNIEVIAWTKLKDAGLDMYFDFGGFGDMAFVRSELVGIAAERGGVNPRDIVLLGDSPRDIKCAKDAGVRIIAVAAGKYKPLDLVGMEPDLLVESMTEKDNIVSYLENI
jgi:phosphoglycolate phosphatase